MEATEAEAPTFKTSWFTFGFDHTREIDGVVYNQDCVVKITAPNPRNEMVARFGTRWAFEYDEEPDLARWYPRGVLLDVIAGA